MKTIKELKETLSEKVPLANEVLIVPHISPDFDALGSSVGLVNICKKLGKKSYILINDKHDSMSSSVNEMISEIKEQYDVIDVKEYLNKINDFDLMITTDVNKDYLIAVKEYLNYFNTKIIIDHHQEEEGKTIKAKYKYINPAISSASEIIAKLLCQYKINYDKKCANYLYAGITLDTNNMRKNISADTLSIASKLIKRGADITYVDKLFNEDFESDRKIQKLIENTHFQKYSYGIVCGQDTIYTKEDLAKAADYTMRYNVDASFVIGLLDNNVIGISGRSNGNINVGEILELLGGGGNLMSGATRINSNNIKETTNKLKLILSPGNQKSTL